MKTKRITVVLAASVTLLIVMPQPPSLGAAADGITLQASRTTVRFGESTKLTGSVDPATAGTSVTITDEDGSTVVEVSTGQSGDFSVTLEPRTNIKLQAASSGAVSEPVSLKVRPLLEVKLGRVRLFDRAQVRGNIRPAVPGQRVTVKLTRRGEPIASKEVQVRDGRWFSTTMRIRRPGGFRARAVVDPPKHLRAEALTDVHTTPLPALSVGSAGRVVKLLEKRLRALGYHLPGPNRTFDYRTADTVLAFHKVQGASRIASVTESTWRKLADPVRPKARFSGGFHVEIDQTRQVLFTVARGKVGRILHTSTGAGGATRDGNFRVHRRLAGTSGGGLYYPSYFDGLRAIHGWPDVPTTPASHGCARVPMWAARWIFGKITIGTRVHVYH